VRLGRDVDRDRDDRDRDDRDRDDHDATLGREQQN